MKRLIEYLKQFVVAFNEEGLLKVNQERTKDQLWQSLLRILLKHYGDYTVNQFGAQIINNDMKMLEVEIIDIRSASAEEEYARSDVLDFVRYFTSIYAVDPNNLVNTIDTVFEQSTSIKINPRMKRTDCTEKQ